MKILVATATFSKKAENLYKSESREAIRKALIKVTTSKKPESQRSASTGKFVLSTTKPGRDSYPKK